MLQLSLTWILLGVKDLFDGCENVGFPIAEVFDDGALMIQKRPGTDGEIGVGTCSSQRVYEIQAPHHFGSDVVAILEVYFLSLAFFQERL